MKYHENSFDKTRGIVIKDTPHSVKQRKMQMSEIEIFADPVEAFSTFSVGFDGYTVLLKQLAYGRPFKEEFERIDMSAYDKYTFSMYGTGMRKLTIVKMRFKNTLTDVVMDKFGYDINTVPDGENHFTTSVPVVISQQLYAWVFGLGPDAEIVSPPAAVRGMKKAIEGIAERYNAETGVVAEARKAGGRKAYRKKYGTLPLTNSRDEDECKPKGL